MSAPPGVPLRRRPTAPSRDTHWMDRIVCRGSTVDFASDAPWEIAAAKRICAGCPVRVECLDHGTARRQTGVYGGVELLVGRPVTQ